MPAGHPPLDIERGLDVGLPGLAPVDLFLASERALGDAGLLGPFSRRGPEQDDRADQLVADLLRSGEPEPRLGPVFGRRDAQSLAIRHDDPSPERWSQPTRLRGPQRSFWPVRLQAGVKDHGSCSLSLIRNRPTLGGLTGREAAFSRRHRLTVATGPADPLTHGSSDRNDPGTELTVGHSGVSEIEQEPAPFTYSGTIAVTWLA